MSKTISIEYYVEEVSRGYYIMRRDKRFWKLGPFHEQSDASLVVELLRKGLLREGQV